MKRKIALVLSSGGARGIAQISIIEELEKQGYEISSIAGCSMGALVGGMYAAGYLPEFKEWVLSLNKKKMLQLSDFSINTNYVVKGERMIEDLKKTIPDINIEDCRIPFTAVATDARHEQEIVFESGSLYAAIRSSISIPFFFKPQEHENQFIMDGGLINPLPINRIRRQKGDLLMAVNVSGFSDDEFLPTLSLKRKKRESDNSLYTLFKNKMPHLSINREQNIQFTKLLTATVGLMIQQNSLLTSKLYPPDILINIPITSFLCFDFFKANKILEYGRRKIQEAITEHQTLLEDGAIQ